MSERPSRTVHAQQAFDLADLFGHKFGPKRFGGRRLRLAEPDGPSTAGGKLARQSIVLVADEPEGTNVIVGWVDGALQQGELRSFAALAQQFNVRGRALDLRREEYDELLADIESFLRIQKIETQRIDVAPIPAPRSTQTPTSEPPPRNSSLPMLLSGIVLGFLLGFLVFGR